MPDVVIALPRTPEDGLILLGCISFSEKHCLHVTIKEFVLKTTTRVDHCFRNTVTAFTFIFRKVSGAKTTGAQECVHMRVCAHDSIYINVELNQFLLSFTHYL